MPPTIIQAMAAACAPPREPRRVEAMTGSPFLNALLFAALGIVSFLIAAAIFVAVAPFNVWKQVVEERNTAAAIVVGAVALGLCWIIAAVMH
jgi:uncharacterized membrane protein YjfL (UPF0719 family)